MRTDSVFSWITRTLPVGGVRLSGKLQARVYRWTAGRLGGKFSGKPVLLLTTTGRHSGQRRSTVVLYMTVADQIVVIGSNAGNERPPAWALNLLANPDADVQLRGKRRQVRARVAVGDERARLWSRMNDHYTGFENYRVRTDRDIKVFVLAAR
jgi:deazaflavin-dependent oxidoreductase (nitroreductase family)